MCVISKEKTYTTKQGLPVRILCTDAPGLFPVVGMVYNGECEDTTFTIHTWTKEGKKGLVKETKNDLVEVIPEKWYPIAYSFGEYVIVQDYCSYKTEKEALAYVPVNNKYKVIGAFKVPQ